MKQSFDVTKERHSTQDPVFWRKGGFQVYSCDVVYVCPGGLLVDWTGIEAGVFYTCNTGKKHGICCRKWKEKNQKWHFS